MNKYWNLIKNVVVLGVGSFTSKILSVVMLPFYTHVLSEKEYGIADLVVNTANLLIPLVSLSIAEAVVRFALESKSYRKDALSIGILTVFGGFAVLLLCYPLMALNTKVSDYIWLIYLYVLMAALNAIMGQFARCIGYVRLFAYSGFQNTALLVIFILTFLLGFRWGIVGYVLSTVLADFLTILFLFWVGNLKRYVQLTGLNRSLAGMMYRFSIPLIPNTLCWWIINLSDRYLITYLMENGEAVNGLYSVAHKIPGFIVMASTVFMQAWQLSAVGEYKSSGKAKFYSNVFTTFQALVFLCSSFLLLLIQPLTRLLTSGDFYISWQFVPFLILAIAFQCFVNFFGTIYMAAKRSVVNMLTTFAGAAVNVLLNLLLIPFYGGNGAAFATFISYFIVFWIRYWDCRNLFQVRIKPFSFLWNFLLVTAQAVVLLLQLPYYFWICGGLLAVLLALNIRLLLRSVLTLLRRRREVRG